MQGPKYVSQDGRYFAIGRYLNDLDPNSTLDLEAQSSASIDNTTYNLPVNVAKRLTSVAIAKEVAQDIQLDEITINRNSARIDVNDYTFKSAQNGRFSHRTK